MFSLGFELSNFSFVILNRYVEVVNLHLEALGDILLVICGIMILIPFIICHFDCFLEIGNFLLLIF